MLDCHHKLLLPITCCQAVSLLTQWPVSLNCININPVRLGEKKQSVKNVAIGIVTVLCWIGLLNEPM